MGAAKEFLMIHEQLPNEVEFLPHWEMGSGSFDGAVFGPHAPILRPGQLVKGIDDRARHFVIIGTRLGNLVVYQRNPFVDSIVAYNCPEALDHAMGLTELILTYSDLIRIFHPTGNIGIWLEKVYENLKNYLMVNGRMQTPP